MLCPIDWKPSNNTADTISTISNTLTESYEDRLENLQREFGNGVVVTDLDAKHAQEEEKKTPVDVSATVNVSGTRGKDGNISRRRSQSEGTLRVMDDKILPNDGGDKEDEAPSSSPPARRTNDCLPRGSVASTRSTYSFHREPSVSAPSSSNSTPLPTPSAVDGPAQQLGRSPIITTARHVRGTLSMQISHTLISIYPNIVFSSTN